MESGAKIRVRPAIPDDMIDILVVRIASWNAAYRKILPVKFLDGMRKETKVEVPRGSWVVESGGIVVGYCFVSPAHPGAVQIHELYVHPDHFRMGLGRALLDGVLASLHRDRFEEVGLWVLAKNDRAHAFYEAMGFKRDRQKREFMTGGEKQLAVLYRRPL